MPDFKLISADSHVNEPPAAWERVQKEYGERAPRVVKDPPGVPKGIWLLIDGLPPVGLSHYSKVSSSKKLKASLKSIKRNISKPFALTRRFATKIIPAAGNRAARLKDQDTDGVDAEVLFSSAARQLYSITDEPFQRAIFHSYNEWLA